MPRGPPRIAVERVSRYALLAPSGRQLLVTPTYYVFRHLSRFVVPGAEVVATRGGDAVAFRNPDGSVVAVVHNASAAAKTITVAIAGRKLQFGMPASGWATVVVSRR